MKLLLNDNQSFMILNAGRQLITNEANWSLEEDKIKQLLEDKIENQKIKLLNYIEARKQNNTLSDVDKLLIKYLDYELQEKIKSQVRIDLYE